MLVREQERSRKKLRRRIAAVSFCLLLLIGLLAAISRWEKNEPPVTGDKNISGVSDASGTADDVPSDDGTSSGSSSGEDRMTVRYNGQWYQLRDDVDTMLIMGIDQTEEIISTEETYVNEGRSDFLLLLVIDRKAETCRALHINRDAMAEIPRLGVNGQKVGTITGQLALSHTFGSGGLDSCMNTLEAVEGFLYDTPINHCMSLTMDAVRILNDEVGGVTLTVLDDFGNIDEALVKGKEVTLQGEQALRYVRARSGMEDSSNLRRMERQRQYMQALYKKLEEKLSSDEQFSLDVLLALSEYLVSDCTINDLAAFADTLRRYELESIEPIKGESVRGEKYMEFYPDEDALEKQIIDLFYEPIDRSEGELS